MNLYVSSFHDSRVLDVERFGPEEEESGIKRATFLLAGREHIAMDSGGNHAFTFTPAMSLVADFDDESQLDAAFKPASRRVRPS